MLQGYDWMKGVHIFAFRMVLNGLQNALSVWSLPHCEHTYIYTHTHVISFMNIFPFLRLGFSSLLSPPDGTMKQKRKLL